MDDLLWCVGRVSKRRRFDWRELGGPIVGDLYLRCRSRNLWDNFLLNLMFTGCVLCRTDPHREASHES